MAFPMISRLMENTMKKKIHMKNRSNTFATFFHSPVLVAVALFPNDLRSTSASISLSPECHIWLFCIGLHSALRFLVAVAYFNFYSYTFFTLFEYCVVFSNMAFHLTAFWDFKSREMVVISQRSANTWDWATKGQYSTQSDSTNLVA
ncbi:post-GPI attachment to proteins factor 2-like [Oncorhynchus tshawytscha]|uniref:post-GPI attachment to proteins factor 2-like n=1 Tax=Oncorhynchus tshawytscha TaxID=74940 RepID=UPI000D0A72C8|nr:post-GPI attachment to proteins factor 2-like [Oncorhynchus tshawytscha]